MEVSVKRELTVVAVSRASLRSAFSAYTSQVRLLFFFGTVMAELQCAKRASDAPWVMKIGKPSSR